MDCFKMELGKTVIRIFNSLPSKKNIDVYIGGLLVFENVKYKEFTPYIYLLKDVHKVDIYESGTKENPLIRTTIRLPIDQIFTIAVSGNQGEESLIIIEEEVEQMPSKEDAIARTVNLAPNLSSVDLFFNGKISLNNVGYRDQTLYAYLPPGEYYIEVKDSEDKKNLAMGRFNFKTDRIYTIYIVGDNSNIDLIQSVDGNTYICR